MVEYPLPTPNPDHIIQSTLSAKDQQQKNALEHIAKEALTYLTYDNYLDALRADKLEAIPAPNEENLVLLVEDEYGSIHHFYDAVTAGEVGDIDTIRVKLARIKAPPGVTIRNPNDLLEFAKTMSDYDREHLKTFHLDYSNRIIGIENVSTGSLGSASAHPREVIKGAILNNSAGVIIAHNHPSGTTEPSQADKQVAQGLINAFALVGIDVLDFVIIGDGKVKSFKDDGILPTPNPFVKEMASRTSEHGDACSVAYQAALEVMGEKCEKDE